MKTPLPAKVCRVLLALALCLGVIIAPAAGVNCGAAAIPAKCHCCKNPQQGCCAGEQNAPVNRQPLPAPPVQSGLRDMAASPASVIALLPAITVAVIPKVCIGINDHGTRLSLHSRLCIRMV